MATQSTPNQTALAVIDTSAFMLMQFGQDDVKELMRDMLGDGGMSISDMPRVKVPSSGGTTWEIPDPTAEGGVNATRTLEGVIVAWTEPWAFWEKSLDEGGAAAGSPPDCYSLDGHTGIGTPGGACESCPMRIDYPSQCNPKRLLFILRPDSLLPIVVQVPRMSIKAIKSYFFGLGGRGIHYRGVMTKLTLKATKNAAQQPYSVIEASMVGPLSDDDKKTMWAYAESIRPMVAHSTREEVVVTEDAPATEEAATTIDQ